MERMSSSAMVQGETMLCIPTDSLRRKKRQRLLTESTTGESHNHARNISEPPPPRKSAVPGSSSRREISLESSVDSSPVVDPLEVSEDSNTESRSRSRGHWSFTTTLSFSCETPSHFSSDVISAIDYDESGQLVATGGLARKIRICSYGELIREVNRSSRSLKNLFTTICMPAKLSSLKWRPGSSEVIACGDYDGSVTEWDVAHGATVSERYEHAGRTVWSVDYGRSAGFSGLLASASSDGTVRLWSRSSERSVGMITAPRGNSMCAVQFGSSFQVAAACADAAAYVYDLRKLEGGAVAELRGHTRSVSYVRWLGERKVVTSSPDGSVRLWDVSERRVEVRFDRHRNARNFVGLSAVDCPVGGGLVATGSESNEVFIYGCSRESPVFRQRFESGVTENGKAFVGSVCWTRQEGHYALISANSEGGVQVIQASQN